MYRLDKLLLSNEIKTFTSFSQEKETSCVITKISIQRILNWNMTRMNSWESRNSYFFSLEINNKKKRGNNDRLQSKTTELSQFSTRKLVFESFPAGLNLDMTSDPSGRALCNLFNSIRHGHIYSQRKVEILCSLKSTKKENNNVRLL